MPPIVSVVVPVYEAANDIGVALHSIFQQTYIDFEVLLINDGSRDTPALERAIARYRGRIVYLVQENAGAGAARNRGILASRGVYIAFLDADDRWEPQCLRTQVEYLERHPECDLVYADAMLS